MEDERLERKSDVFFASCLYDAIEGGNLSQVTTILQNKDADPNVLLPRYGIAPFHLISGNESEDFAEEVTKLFLQHGGDPNVQSTEEDLTPVHIAVIWGKTKVLQLLLVNGGNPWLHDAYKNNAFHYAIEEKNEYILDMLHQFQHLHLDSNEVQGSAECKIYLDKVIVSSGDVCIAYRIVPNAKQIKCVSTQTSKEDIHDTTMNKNNYLTLPGMCSSIIPKIKISGNDLNSESISNLNAENQTNTPQNAIMHFSASSVEKRSDEETNGLLALLSNSSSSYSWSETSATVSSFGAESGIAPLPDDYDISELFYGNERLVEWLGDRSYFLPCSSSSLYETCEECEPCATPVLTTSHNSPVLGQGRVPSPGSKSKCSGSSVQQPESSDSHGSSKTVMTLSEEYKYTDDDEGIALYERRLLVTPAIISDLPESGSDTDEPSFAESYDTDALREELKARGYTPGPITATTKRVYRRQLFYSRPVITTNDRIYSPELQRTLKKIVWEVFTFPCKKLEEQIVDQFAEPDPRRCWREGVIKSSFSYLLLDPRITNNLPNRASELSPVQVWTTFLASVFYIGKGKRSRPYSHLYQAVTVWNKKNVENKDEKIQRILDIWKAGLGVICLHVFQNVIPAEAYTREAAMIDAIGLQNLCNSRHGEYYGKAAAWISHNKKLLGVYLLYRTMHIFLSEGERQLRPCDIG